MMPLFVGTHRPFLTESLFVPDWIFSNIENILLDFLLLLRLILIPKYSHRPAIIYAFETSMSAVDPIYNGNLLKGKEISSQGHN